jgi:hypothetical protein
LKNKFSFAPILKFLDFTKPFEVHIDAIDFAIGGVFMQDGHPIAFESKNFMGPNYDGQLMRRNCTLLCVA